MHWRKGPWLICWFPLCNTQDFVIMWVSNKLGLHFFQEEIDALEARMAAIPRRTMPRLTCWVCGANPSTLERKVSQDW